MSLQASDKTGVLAELLALPARFLSMDRKDLMQAVLERECLGSTGIGGGIAIPHGRLEMLDAGLLVFGKSKKGIPFDAMDGRPVHLFFLFLTPVNMPGLHLEMLGLLSKFLRVPGVREKLRKAEHPEDVSAVFATV